MKSVRNAEFDFLAIDVSTVKTGRESINIYTEVTGEIFFAICETTIVIINQKGREVT